jgi:hypothetical protein
LVAAFGSKSKQPARIATPFILERANHAKAWDAKRQTLPVSGMVAALPKGWTPGEPTVHPATHGDRRLHEVVPIRGRSLPVCLDLLRSSPSEIFTDSHRKLVQV